MHNTAYGKPYNRLGILDVILESHRWQAGPKCDIMNKFLTYI